MSDLRFAEPAFVHALWVVAASLALLFWLEGRGGRLLGDFVATPMQRRIVRRGPGWRRRARFAAIAVSLTATVVALMRPQWGFEFVQSRAVGAEIMIALDVSRSMLAEDVAPNRLERAKAEIRDLLPYLEGDQVGLIAFAGRASVLCPLTPDFGFLRLVLDRVDTRSVTRGGTRLEEPIRKATAGFGPSGDFARVILLITDGEDHDSFPVDAAREAAERGIRILAIGFGDEAGSEILVTDPVTGARGRVTDADGRPVLSRLDGELLRELALVSEGAYVPAGTGVLDLESIFEAHIRPLMRAEGSETGRTIHKDGFQWALLVAWIALLVAVLLGSGGGTLLGSGGGTLLGSSGGTLLGSSGGALLGVLLGASLGVAPPSAFAALEAAPPVRTEELNAGAVPDTTPAADPLDTETTAAARLEIPEVPREAFNAGLDALESGALDDAERLFEAARRSARGDGETRYRASYDLGWVEVARADAQLESEPEQALASLERSADWFREAIALRPAADEPRRNLEIVLARALILADSLAQRESKTLEQRLEAMIEAQRAVNRDARALVEVLDASDDPNAADALRARFKALAVEERQLLAEAGAAAKLAATEHQTLQAVPDAERTPEDAMRVAQLEGLQAHVHRARERVGQARGQLRRRDASRAHRRGAVAVEHLKRAREQLQDPVRILDGLMTDASELAGETRLLAATEIGLAVGPTGDHAAPDWLDTAYLGDVQASITDRTGELDQRFAGAVAQTGTVEDPEQRALLEQVAAAAPHLTRAHDHFVEAGDALDGNDVSAGAETQLQALEALALAREQLLDLRGLIELVYRDEQRIASVLEPPTASNAAAPGNDVPAASLDEYVPALVALQQRNLDRAQRLTTMIEEVRGQLETPDATAPDTTPAEQVDAERKRLEMADGLLALTESAMRGALGSFGELGSNDDATEQSRTRVGSAVKGLEALRRLFFSIVEHLRDTIRRQAELSDAAESVGGRPADEHTAALAPVAARQSSLGEQTEKLAEALHEQSLADPAALVGPEAAQDPAVAEQVAERLTRAAEFVLEASTEMDAAGSALAEPSAAIDAARTHQDTASGRLAEALALLEPPQPEEQQDDGSEQQEQQKPGEEEEDEQPTETPEQSRDPGQILQSVRDREAERHRERRARSSGYEPVDRDW
ncbi:MAG: hypothetical protein CL938_00720 [Deltaproteobacteria bacterium]|nr:hypothetical protein [Deltaproteobacteria bacterium]MDP6244066.1 VWA domain-containing protein [Myxococcota bacterium]